MSTEAYYNNYMSQLRSIIENECDGSRMSEAKWQKLIGTLITMRQQISFSCRVKVLTDGAACGWVGFLPYMERRGPDGTEKYQIEPSGGPVLNIAIEWIEIQPTGLYNTGTHWTKMPDGYQNQIERQLDALNVPYTVEDDIIRVTGHVRRSTPPIITRSR